MTSEVDPITYSVVVRSLTEFCSEIADTLTQTARNPALSLAKDFSVAIVNDNEELVSGEEGLPVHLGAIDKSVEKMADSLTIEQGDILLTNDPYDGANTHMADFTLALPVFPGKEDLLLWVVIRAHQADVGAVDTGAMAPRATDIYDEGIRLTPLKIVSRDERKDDILDMIAQNSRVETVQKGDLLAMIGAAQIGERLIKDLTNRYSSEIIRKSVSQLLATTEESIRDRIRGLPNGTYIGRSQSDTNPATGEPVRVVVELSVTDEELIFDFSKSDNQVESCINNSLAVTHAAVNLSWICTVELDFPMNAGAFEPIHINAPKGLIVNPEFPHATSYATLDFFQETAEACWKAVAKAAPDKLSGGYSRWVRPITSGHDSESGEQYTTYQLYVMGGGGAAAGIDGANAIGGFTIFGGLTITDPELHEALFPYHIHELDLRTDSGGAGRFRGGLGTTFAVSPVDHTADFAIGGDFGQTVPPFGHHGGHPGEAAHVFIESPHDQTEIEESFQIVPVTPDEQYIQYSAGGGGYGDPLDRNPKKVLKDVKNEYISVEAAREEYGVVILGETLEIDQEKTCSLREEQE